MGLALEMNTILFICVLTFNYLDMCILVLAAGDMAPIPTLDYAGILNVERRVFKLRLMLSSLICYPESSRPQKWIILGSLSGWTHFPCSLDRLGQLVTSRAWNYLWPWEYTGSRQWQHTRPWINTFYDINLFYTKAHYLFCCLRHLRICMYVYVWMW